jgi:large subunit ribosomal protein L13
MDAQNGTIVFDAENKVLGRIASAVAKRLLEGDTVAVVNAEKAIISGRKKVILERYKTRIDLKEKANPEHSPYWSRRSDLLVKRIIRGMLPYRMPRGKAAYRRLRVFIGVPESLSKLKLVEIESKNPANMYVEHITIAELSRLLGYEKA